MINDKIKTLRIAQGMTQQELAEKLDIPMATIMEIEAGEEMPSAALVMQLDQLFGYKLLYPGCREAWDVLELAIMRPVVNELEMERAYFANLVQLRMEGILQ